MMKKNKSKFESFEELGIALKDKRKEKDENIESISRKLFIKKIYIEAIELGNLSKFSLKDTYIKGFIRSYSNYLDKNLSLDIENLFTLEKDNLKKTKVSLQITPPKEKVLGSIIILLSLIVMGAIYLIWQRQTYIDLYEIGQKLSLNFDFIYIKLI